MAITTCPRCGKPRDGWERICSSCGHDFWKAAESGASQTAPPAQQAAPTSKRSSPVPFILGGLIVLAILAGVYSYLSGTADQIATDVGNELDNGAAANIPPVGEVWFGSSFDADTFEIRGRTDSVGINEPFSLVAQLPRSMRADELGMRVSLDGELVTNEAVNATGEGELWGFSTGPLFQVGIWTYEFIDIGGNILASGEVEATE